MSDAAIDSSAFFKNHWLGFRICGGHPPPAASATTKQRCIYFLYALVINMMVNVYYPFHLAMALIRNFTFGDIKTLTVCFTAITCTMKFIIYIQKFRRMREIEQLFNELDGRVSGDVERKSFARLSVSVRNISVMFFCVYIAIGLSGELVFLLRCERALLYPAWFPYDWKSSQRNFALTNIYQFVSTMFQITQNLIHDSFPPIACCLLSGHIELLGVRMKQIGWRYGVDKVVDGGGGGGGLRSRVSKQDNERELVRCIKDQQNLFKLFNLLQDVISWPMFIQILTSTFNICITLVAVLFYTDTLFEYFYYAIYFSAMAFQLFPICYYGSNLQYLFGALHYELFCCNWIEQTPRFKKMMIIFTERTLRETTAMAGGMLRIKIETFLSTMKGAYSLFAVVMKVK